MIVDWGSQSFTIHIPEFGVEKLVHVKEIKGVKSCSMRADHSKEGGAGRGKSHGSAATGGSSFKLSFVRSTRRDGDGDGLEGEEAVGVTAVVAKAGGGSAHDEVALAEEEGGGGDSEELALEMMSKISIGLSATKTVPAELEITLNGMWDGDEQ